jgi:hypothetical protein
MYKWSIVDAEEAKDSLQRLENAIHKTWCMSFLLAAAQETSDDDGGNKREAVAFAVYEVDRHAREMKAAYDAYLDERTTVRSEGQDTTFYDDEYKRKKIVNLH